MCKGGTDIRLTAFAFLKAVLFDYLINIHLWTLCSLLGANTLINGQIECVYLKESACHVKNK